MVTHKPDPAPSATEEGSAVPYGFEYEYLPAAATTVFGSRLERATAFAVLLREEGVRRGVIGPRELDRLWERHLLNSAVLGEAVPHGASVVDVGSGAGLPGVPLAIARPDLDMVLVESMARRVDWLHEALRRTEVDPTVVRGRAEERTVRERVAGVDVVAARALAPLARLCTWCLPLVRPGGVMLAMKGASARTEVDRDRDAMSAAGAATVDIIECGTGVVDTPATVVSITKKRSTAANRKRSKHARRSGR